MGGLVVVYCVVCFGYYVCCIVGELDGEGGDFCWFD